MSVIKAEKITKVYTETAVPVHALNGVDLAIEEGEFTAIVGPSGCGKTTLLNILGGLDHPTSGTVEVADTDITSMGDGDLIDFRLKNIGFVFQAYNLIPVLTTIENVEFIMLLQKKDKKERVVASESTRQAQCVALTKQRQQELRPPALPERLDQAPRAIDRPQRAHPLRPAG